MAREQECKKVVPLPHPERALVAARNDFAEFGCSQTQAASVLHVAVADEADLLSEQPMALVQQVRYFLRFRLQMYRAWDSADADAR